MKLAALVGLTSLCGIALVGSAGCGDAGSGSPATSSAALQPKNGVYTVEIESNSSSTLPACNSKTAGETAMVTSTDILETCVLGVWVPVPCLVGGAVAFNSATDSLWACTESTDGGPASWAQITLPQGATGPQGPQGPKGDAGPTGPTGAQGPSGAQGATGPQGPTGSQGATGPQGPMGAQGVAGAQGPQGDAGATGPVGPEGPRGPEGAQGDPGAAGAPGAQGPQGATGEAGANGANGANALIVQTPFAAGAGSAAQTAACPTGGTEIDTGTDNGTGAFAGPVTTTYVCNGAGSGGAPACNATNYAQLAPNLSGCDLTGANLDGVNLAGTNLSAANLTSASLIGASLNGATLTSAGLTGAELTNADEIWPTPA